MAEEIGVLRVDLSLNSADFVKSTQQVDSKLRALNSEFKASKSGVEGFEKSVEGLRAKQDFLSKTLELQKTKVSTLKAEYDKIAQAQGANSVEAEKMLVKYNNAVAALKKTETQLQKTTKAISEQENPWRKVEIAAKDYKGVLESTTTSLKSFGDRSKEIGSNLSLGLTTPIVAAGTAVGMLATQFEDAQVKIQNSLGLTTEEAGRLSEVAENVWAQGFGDSLNTVSDALVRVRQNIKGINSDAELEEVTRNAIILAETFDSDINEVTRAGNNLMTNFGIESQKAFDLMAMGAQNGLNFSNEMFDNLAEYSALFADMGYSAEEYFQLLINGSEKGVYNLDYINDSMKEFQIRLKDGSKTTSDAMGNLSESTQNVWKEFLKGNKTVKDVANTVLTELESMDDQVLANQIGVGLWGTKWEDLESDAMYSLKTVDKQLKNVTGSMDKMTKVQEQTFSQRWQQLLRQAQKELEPIGREVLDLAEDWLPKLTKGLERIVGWFDDLGEEGQKLTITLAGIAAAGGPLLMGGGMIANGASSVLKLASSFASAATKGGLLGTAMAAMSGPAGWAVLGATAVAGLGVAIYNLAKDSEKTSEELLKLQEETFNNAIASYEAAQKNVELANSYDELRDKSSLTVDELLRYKEIQAEIENTTSSEKVAELKDELASLQEKSGLTSDELSRMIELDQQIIDTVPGVEAAYNSKGEAVVKYSESVKKVTQAQLELQKAEAMTTLTKTIDGLGEQISKLNELRESYVSLSETKTELEKQEMSINQELQNIELERLEAKQQGIEYDEQTIEVYSRQREISQELKDIRSQQKDATGEHLELLKQQEETLLSEREILNGANGELMTREEYLEESLRLIQEELKTNEENLNTTSQEKSIIEEKLALTKLQYNQILDYLAKEVGITAEEGKQLEAMQAQYDKNAEIIRQLQNQKGTAEGITAEEQNRLEELIKQNEQIENNIDEAELLNSTLSKDITKELGIDDKGEVDKINKEASKTVSKVVQFKQAAAPYSYSSAIESLFTNPATKYVRFRPLNDVPQYAKGTDNHPGGLAIVGEKGPELGILPTGKQVLLGASGTEMVSLPKGSKVLTNEKTESLFNIRWFAEGGIVDSPTIFGRVGSTLLGAGEAGKEAIAPIDKLLGYVRTAVKEQMGNVGYKGPSTIVVQSVLDGRIVAESITPFVSTNQNSSTNLKALTKGVSL